MSEIDQQPFRIALSNGFRSGVEGTSDMPGGAAEIKLIWRRGYLLGSKYHRLMTVKPDEHAHQVTLFGWASMMEQLRPELRLLFAVPNAGKRTAYQGAYMLAEGMRKGVNDIVLPVPLHGRGGLYIELKTPKTAKTRAGTATAEQKAWLELVDSYGSATALCFGWVDARDTIERYLDGLM